jgi:hypothetical protein
VHALNSLARENVSMKLPKSHRIAVLFNANKIFDREVIAGIAAHLASTRASWDSSACWCRRRASTPKPTAATSRPRIRP